MASLSHFGGESKQAAGIITNPVWVQDVHSELTGQYDELLAATRHAYRRGAYTPWNHAMIYDDDEMGPNSDVYEYYEEDQQEFIDEYANEIHLQLDESQLFRSADAHTKLKMLRALRGDFRWAYTMRDMQDGFFEGVAVERAVRPDALSRYVLSGLLGEQILRDDKKTRHAAEQLGDIAPYNRAVLVGGAALAATTGPMHIMSTGGLYLGVERGDVQFETWTGGDPNGDFRTERIQRPRFPVSTTLDVSQRLPFMPVVGSVEKASMYHSAEPNLVRALLTHAVLRAGYPAMDMYGQIVAKLESESIRYGGNFGDYDQGDGVQQATNLRMYLDDPKLIGDNEALLRSIVMPGLEYQMTLSSTEGGVKFENSYADGAPYSSMFIPNEEIADYIATLVSGGGGRSGPRSMLAVINALKPEDAV